MAAPPQIVMITSVGRHGVRAAFRFALGALFIVAVAVYGGLYGGTPDAILAAAAGGFGAYMALNIGANDVANNVGPAIGANVLKLGSALAIAAIFEAAGALIAGGEVIGTIRGGIINPALVPSTDTLIWLMMAALLAAALWLNIASAMSVPIATTHSIVGGVLGASVVASGFATVNWSSMGFIAMGWVISPVLGGIIAAAFLYLIKRTITYQHDRVCAARKQVPLLVAIMAWAFSTYLLSKGLARIWPINFTAAAVIGLAFAVSVYYGMRLAMSRIADTLENNTSSINRLFALPLIFSVALLSFAHGANDVANAIAPLAAILDLLSHSAEISRHAPIPLWVMATGAVGIALGLVLYGPRVIRTVSTEITALDPMRAYSIAMATALTVMLASQLGLPISTTHVAIGAILGIGLLREYLKFNYQRIIDAIRTYHAPADKAGYNAFMRRFIAATLAERGRMLATLKQDSKNRLGSGYQASSARKQLHQVHKQELVKRALVYRIVIAWLITVPASATIAAILFFMLRSALLA